ncbi:MAG: histidine phosphatase family protein [Burkholderiales bacterium]
MAELLLVRHAQASFGSADYDRLSELGWRQSRWLGEYFAERRIAFDRILCGTLQRHAETLAGIGGGMGIEPACETEAGLDEYDSLALLRAHTGQEMTQGGDRRAHFRLLREALYAWTDGALALAPHERFDAFRGRVLTALAAIRAQRARRVLVVSSGGPISTILAEVLAMPARGIVDLNLQVRNTGISELQFNERTIRCVSFNTIPHLDRPDRPGTLTYA